MLQRRGASKLGDTLCVAKVDLSKESVCHELVLLLYLKGDVFLERRFLCCWGAQVIPHERIEYE